MCMLSYGEYYAHVYLTCILEYNIHRILTRNIPPLAQYSPSIHDALDLIPSETNSKIKLSLSQIEHNIDQL